MISKRLNKNIYNLDDEKIFFDAILSIPKKDSDLDEKQKHIYKHNMIYLMISIVLLLFTSTFFMIHFSLSKYEIPGTPTGEISNHRIYN
jgi:hypothetical protein